MAGLTITMPNLHHVASLVMTLIILGFVPMIVPNLKCLSGMALLVSPTNRKDVMSYF